MAQRFTRFVGVLLGVWGAVGAQVAYDVGVDGRVLFAPDAFGRASSAIEVKALVCAGETGVAEALGFDASGPAFIGRVLHFDTPDRRLESANLDLRFRDRRAGEDPTDRKKSEVTFKVRDLGAAEPAYAVAPERAGLFQIKRERGIKRDAEEEAAATVARLPQGPALSVTYQPGKSWAAPADVDDAWRAATARQADPTLAEDGRCAADTFLARRLAPEQLELLRVETGIREAPEWVVTRAYELRSWEFVSPGDGLAWTLEERRYVVPEAKVVYELSYKINVLEAFAAPARLLDRVDAEIAARARGTAWACDDLGQPFARR